MAGVAANTQNILKINTESTRIQVLQAIAM
jgi:hypothetical protein